MANPLWEEGRAPSWQKQSNFTKGQEQNLQNITQQQNQLAGQGGGYQDAMSLLQQYLNPNSDVYKNFEKPYLEQYQNQTLPEIANRYAGQNAMGSGLMTSGFGQSLGAAGSSLQAQLAQMKQQYQRQSINDLLNQYNQLTNTSLGTRSFENVYDPGTQGQNSFLGNILEAGVTGAATAFGGPLGGAAAKGALNLFKGGAGGGNQESSAFSAGTPSGGGGYQGGFGPLPNYLG